MNSESQANQTNMSADMEYDSIFDEMTLNEQVPMYMDEESDEETTSSSDDDEYVDWEEVYEKDMFINFKYTESRRRKRYELNIYRAPKPIQLASENSRFTTLQEARIWYRNERERIRLEEEQAERDAKREADEIEKERVELERAKAELERKEAEQEKYRESYLKKIEENKKREEERAKERASKKQQWSHRRNGGKKKKTFAEVSDEVMAARRAAKRLERKKKKAVQDALNKEAQARERKRVEEEKKLQEEKKQKEEQEKKEEEEKRKTEIAEQNEILESKILEKQEILENANDKKEKLYMKGELAKVAFKKVLIQLLENVKLIEGRINISEQHEFEEMMEFSKLIVMKMEKIEKREEEERKKNEIITKQKLEEEERKKEDDATWSSVPQKKKKPKQPVIEINFRMGDRKEEMSAKRCVVMCKYILNNEVCKYGSRCRFAHSPSELVRDECFYKKECKSVIFNNDTQEWENRRGAKICEHLHPEETDSNLQKRKNRKVSISPMIVPTHTATTTMTKPLPAFYNWTRPLPLTPDSTKSPLIAPSPIVRPLYVSPASSNDLLSPEYNWTNNMNTKNEYLKISENFPDKEFPTIKDSIKFKYTTATSQHPKKEIEITISKKLSPPLKENRTEAFEIMENKELLQNKLTKTRMCKSVSNNTRCPHGSRCRFAHSVEELRIPLCFFKDCCRFVRRDNNGRWCNTTNKKICDKKHPEETEKQVLERIRR